MLYLPRVYQETIRTFALDEVRCNVFAGMGTGKTSASLDLYQSARYFGEAKRALVLGPKLVAEMTWPDEREKWLDTFGNVSIAAAIGTLDQRLAALRKTADVTTINYDMIEWLIDIYGDHWPFDMVLADEFTRLKGLRISEQVSKLGNQFINGQGSKRAKALSKIAHTKIRRWVNLGGSPAPNGIADLWGPMYFVDKGKRLGTSFGGYHDRFFDSYGSADGYGVEWKPKSTALAEVTSLIKDKSLTIDARDYFDITEPIPKTILVPLPPKARRIYNEMEQDFFTEVERGGVNFEVEAVNGGSKMNKCRQIGSGFVFHAENEWVHLHDAKIEALKSVMEEANGASVLVSFMYKPELAAILKAFPKAAHLKNKREIARFQHGDLQMGLAHPASVGHGHNLQDNCWILCDYSTGWNLEEDEQIFGRIGPVRQAQSGYKRAVFRIRLVAENTVEHKIVVPRIATKSSVQDCVRAAMKRSIYPTGGS